jgi:hypothetical protein
MRLRHAGANTPTGRQPKNYLESPTNPAERYAPNALSFPFTGLAPASRWAGTRSRAGSV